MSALLHTAQLPLVDYGIHTEKSDLRVHVCVNAQRAYVYPTAAGIAAVNKAIEVGKQRTPGYQPGVNYATAEGYLVKPESIARCLPISIVWALPLVGGIRFSDDTSTKGRKAVEVVTLMLRRGWFPMFATPEVIDDIDLQINGLDIVVRQTTRIQVKCDFEGGSPIKSGLKGERVTGNLFLQVAESNPLKHV